MNKYVLTGRPLGPGFPAGPGIPCKRDEQVEENGSALTHKSFIASMESQLHDRKKNIGIK